MEAPTGDAPSDDYLIPAEVQSDWPAMAQMAEAGSKPSLTTVDSILVASTHVAVKSDAGSVMLVLAGSVVLPFSNAAGTVFPERRMSALLLLEDRAAGRVGPAGGEVLSHELHALAVGRTRSNSLGSLAPDNLVVTRRKRDRVGIGVLAAVEHVDLRGADVPRGHALQEAVADRLTDSLVVEADVVVLALEGRPVVADQGDALGRGSLRDRRPGWPVERAHDQDLGTQVDIGRGDVELSRIAALRVVDPELVLVEARVRESCGQIWLIEVDPAYRRGRVGQDHPDEQGVGALGRIRGQRLQLTHGRCDVGGEGADGDARGDPGIGGAARAGRAGRAASAGRGHEGSCTHDGQPADFRQITGPPAPDHILQTHQTCALQPEPTDCDATRSGSDRRPHQTFVRQAPDGWPIEEGLSTPRTKNHPNGGFLVRLAHSRRSKRPSRSRPARLDRGPERAPRARCGEVTPARWAEPGAR